MAKSIRSTLSFAARNPRFLILLAVAFVVRGDVSVVSTFLSLWAMSAAKQSGLGAAAGLVSGGALLTYITVSGLVAALATGWLADHVDRFKLLIGALVLAAMSHMLTLSISDLHSAGAVAVFCLLGAGESSLVIAGQALLGQEAPAATRGAAIGLFGFCGSIGVLLINVAGGMLFDKVTHAAPFVLIGAIDVAIFASAVLALSRRRAAG